VQKPTLLLAISLWASCCAPWANAEDQDLSLKRAVLTEFRNLEEHYSALLGEKITFEVKEVHRGRSNTSLSIVFDVLPGKYKPLGNKIGVFRRDQQGTEYHLQVLGLKEDDGKLVGPFGPQIGVPMKHWRKITLGKQ